MTSFKFDSASWDNMYETKNDKWDIGINTPAFIESEKSIKRHSKILVPGCGRGYDAIYLASKNHSVSALDFSKSATSHISKALINDSININIYNQDFFTFDDRTNNNYDYIFEYTFFCAIEPTRRLEYVEKCYNLLQSKGKIIGIFLPISINNIDDSPPFKVTVDEICLLFSDLFKINILTKNINSIPQRRGNEFYVEMSKR